MDGVPLSNYEQQLIERSLLQAGLHISDIRVESLRDSKYPATEERKQSVINRLNSMENLELIVPMGNDALELITGKTSIDKWHLSPLDTLEGIRAPKAVPTFTPRRINQEYKLRIYITKTFQRAKEGLSYKGPWKRKPKNFLLNPTFDETIDILKMLKTKSILANDIETGGGQINTVGFAWSPNDAIAIGTLPSRLSAEKFKILWDHIAEILENENIGKILQNLTYETMYYSIYGIDLNNYYFDTMWAMRVLWPEFDIGLDNVGRHYTNEPYWKDTGKDYKSEGGKRDWANVRDWQAHYLYNCLDTSGTYEAHDNQLIDLKTRGLDKFYFNYLMRLADPIKEMCVRGLPINEVTRAKLQKQLEDQVKELTESLSSDINPKSPKQKLKLLEGKGYQVPKVRVKGVFQKSTNELSLKKLRLKHPNDKDLEILLKLTHLNKALSSYVIIDYHSDGKLRFSLNGVGTETLRFSCSKDPWDKGLNAQTLPSKYKHLFDAPLGKRWVAVDLAQAESRFVAYDSCDENLIRMIEDPNEDIHKFVASHIFEKPQSEIVKSERQLGKKSGHGANYDMAANTFMESCLKEMDLVLTRRESQRILDIYHSLFPGIRRWQAEIKKTVWDTKKLANPLGYERYFYGRMDDNTFREAYAFKPQSTIPMITNHLMIGLLDERRAGKFKFDLHLQVHDSVLLLTDDNPDHYLPITEYCYDTNRWHPEIRLRAGQLVIPTEVESGINLGNLEVIHL